MNLNVILILPGAIFLMIIFLRVILPMIKNPQWKRMLNNARYHRHRKNFEKSDAILEQAIKKYPDEAGVYLDYYLNHSKTEDLQHRFQVLFEGYERTKNIGIAFFIGSAYLEEGKFAKARQYLDNPDVRRYMRERNIPLIAQLEYEAGDYRRARHEFLDFYRKLLESGGERRKVADAGSVSAEADVQSAVSASAPDPAGENEGKTEEPITDPETEKILSELTARELTLYVLIIKAEGGDWIREMNRVKPSGFHAEMSWSDYLSMLKEAQSELKPAETGINGDPGEFNRRRRAYYQERIRLIEDYLSRGKQA
ncbi:MAG: hypothetical protein K9L68_08625 [Spirochaetales bacterium]|nr:hypothetical protein [Spirochaetales bacterium]MCF7938649.1 hypothetical protein [Spirochaetales bacterium]